LFVLIVIIPFTALAGIIEGRLAYRKGDYASALQEFGTGTQHGPVASYFLALMYLRGEGVLRDDAQGLKLLQNSVVGGYSPAQYLLGQRYFYGLGVSKDKNRAVSNLQAASTDGDSRARVLLEIIAKGSRDEKKDRERVIATVKRKALANDPDAQYTLGFMYLVGDGVQKNGAEEIRWYRAAAGRNARAAFMLSLMYQHGEGVMKNPAEAFRLMRLATHRDDPRVQYYLGTFYYQGFGTEIDRPAAVTWFRKSAEKGFAEAQLAYGMLLLSGDGVAQDRSKAIEWLSKAAKQDNVTAKEVLRELLTYRGQPTVSPMTGTGLSLNSEKQQNQLRLEGKGVLLDQGTYGLKFSLPTLYDPYAPHDQTAPRPFRENFQGGSFEIIFRPSK
jgi:TPR repeat protein